MMAGLYFDTRDNGELSPDETGQDLPDIEAANRRARETYADRLQGPGADGQEPAFRVGIRTEGDSVPIFFLDSETTSTMG
jgi:hypothetical protein